MSLYGMELHDLATLHHEKCSWRGTGGNTKNYEVLTLRGKKDKSGNHSR